jgi:hypothetical protein
MTENKFYDNLKSVPAIAQVSSGECVRCEWPCGRLCFFPLEGKTLALQEANSVTPVDGFISQIKNIKKA